MGPSAPRRPTIAYMSHREGWQRYVERVHRLIEEAGAKRVCDVGGGANPLVSLDYIDQKGLDYVVVDVSESELAKAPGEYTKVVADICAPNLDLEGFDLVVTCMLAEHVRDPVAFHTNVRSVLKPQGHAFHYFPTLYSLPFLLNRLLPSSFTEAVLDRLQPARVSSGSHGKFPAYYRWCRGPSKRQIRRLAALGYVVEEYVGMMGHSYFRRLPPLQAAIDLSTRLALKWPAPAITSYAWVVLERGPLAGDPAGT